MRVLRLLGTAGFFLIAGIAYVTSLPTSKDHLHFSQVIAFGDSLSDNGNGSYLLTDKAWPADPAYFNGRFSNGPTWIEYLSQTLAANLTDLAFGGATVNNSRVQGYTGHDSDVPVPSVLDNVNQYLHKHSRRLGAETLYVVSGGGNDAFFGAFTPDTDPRQLAILTVQDLMFALKKLYNAGARNFLIPSTPPLEYSPYGSHFANATTSAFLRSFSDAFAKALKRQRPLKGARVTLWDEQHAFKILTVHSERFGFKYVDEACLKGAYPGESPTRQLCSDPDKYVFWDVYHPTTAAHRHLAEFAYKQLAECMYPQRHIRFLRQGA